MDANVTRRTCLGYGAGFSATWLMPAAALAYNSPAAADRYLAMQRAKLRIPGMAVAVVRDGRVVFRRDLGTASVEFDQPVRSDTVFAINSVTKAFTGIAAMRLVQTGLLSLEAPIGRYVAEIPETWRAIEVRRLLSHMSGLPDVMRAATVETDAAAAWAWVRQQPILFPPGQRFHYCQTNYTLVMRAINGLEGREPDAPLAPEQFRLAGMSHTSYGDVFDVIPRRAPTYRWVLPGPFVDGYSAAAPGAARKMNATSERFLPFRRASSGLNSTADDLAAWLIALERGVLLSAEARERMWTPVAFTDGRQGAWGLGWQVLARGRASVVGMTGGGRAAVFYYPEHRVGVVILTNLTGAFPEDMVDKLASLYAPALTLTGVPALRIALEDSGYERIDTAAAAVEAADPTLVWPETELNDWGYRLLSTGRPRDALAVLAMVARLYPLSANAHDSLGQAYLVNGYRAKALTHYRQALALDPESREAARKVALLSGH